MPDKEKIRSLFDGIALGYDSFNHLSTMGIDKCWRRRAVRCIADAPGPLKVLDVATGTGDFALAIAAKLTEASSVVGVDLSEGMLAVGREKIASAGYGEADLDSEAAEKKIAISLQQGDVEALPFDDESFDRVSVAFGVRNFENLELGLSQMCRVLRKGGKLVILELSYPDNRILLALYKLYAFHFLPLLGRILTGKTAAFNYLPASIMHFPKPAVFVPMLLNAGFSSAKASSFTFGVCRMYVAQK